jgi:capsular polysaccharide biosynthesis protein
VIRLGEVIQIIRRQWLVCCVVALVVLLAGSAIVLTRPKAYQSTSSVALLPATSNPNVLPNYPNLIASLIPTYVQLVSSPVLLNQVAATLPFRISESQLSGDVQAESLSNAAIINIVATSPTASQAQQIALRTTTVFLAELRGNGVVVPRIYGRPTVPTQPAASGTALKLIIVLVFAVLLGLAGGLIWDRLFAGADSTGERGRAGGSPPLAVQPPDGQNYDRIAVLAGSLTPGRDSPARGSGPENERQDHSAEQAAKTAVLDSPGTTSARKATKQAARSRPDRSRSKRRPTSPSTRQQAREPAEVSETAALEATEPARLAEATQPAGPHDNNEPAGRQEASEPAARPRSRNGDQPSEHGR